jgi:hypothetical protein
VTITVDPVNDAPVASPGSRTTDEDTELSLDLAALVNDVETSDANLSYEIVAQPAHGTATETTYTPAANFNGADSFTYRVTDRGDPDDCSSAPCDGPETSTTETVSITVDPVNDAPQATDDTRSTDEDTPLSVDLAALASDVETADANLTFTVTQPAHGTVTGTGGSRTYTPAADFNGTDTFTYTAVDRGDPDNCATAPCDGAESATGTITVTVGALNDAPVNTVPAGPVSAPQGSDTPITGLSVADADAAADDIKVTFAVTNGTLTVSTSVMGGVGVLQVAGNGTGTVVVTASQQAITATLLDGNGLVYHAPAAFSGPVTLTMTTDDQGHNGAGGARSDTDTVVIVVNSPPVAAAQSVPTNEDTARTITLSASDADGDDPLTFAIEATPIHGTLGSIGAVACTHATPNECTAEVLYTPAADYVGPDGFTFTAQDGFTTSSPATVSITVTAVNDAPRLENIEGGALAYTENDPATDVTATTTVTDVDSANFDTGTLTVDYATGGTADDRLEIRDQGQIAVSGANVTHAGTTIGTFTGGTGTTPLVVTLNASATPAAVEDLVRAISYRNVSDNPSNAARTARFVLTDGDGGTSAPATRGIALTAVNDPPALAAIEPGALAYTENDPATAVTSLMTVTDPDSNITGATVTIATNLAAAEDVLSFTGQLGITGAYNAATGVLTLSGTASPADYQTALRAVMYRNSSDDPSTLTRTISFQVKDGPNPSNLSNTQSRDVTVTSVNDTPVADDESFTGANSTVGNTSLVGDDPSDGAPALSSPKKVITADILAGDTDVEGDTLVVVAETKATNDGGSVTIEADGDFVFTPKAGTSCTDHTDFFDYTVSDQNAAGPGPTPGTDTGRVTIDIAGCVWYVNNNDPTGNAGTSTAPFDTLAQAEAASNANDTVFVFDGDNTSTGYGGDGYAMNSGERLLGEHEGLTVDPDGAGGPLASVTLHPANPGADPTLTASNADVIDLDDANEVRGFNLDPQGTGGGIAGSTGDVSGTIDDVNINDTGTAGTQPGLELDGTSGTFAVSNFTVNTNGATGVRLTNAGTVTFAPTGNISITSSNAAGLDASGTALGTSTFDTINVTNSGNGGVRIASATAASTIAFGDLSLTTTSGATPAFGVSSSGTVSVPAAGTTNLSATGGPAVDVTGTTVTTLAFDAVSSSGSANDGINLAGLGNGTFSAGSGSISGAAGIAFDLDGGNGDVTYPGSIGNGAGASAEITNHTGGTVSLSGGITDTNDAGGGVTLTDNAGATMNLSGGMVLSTGTSTALNATGGGTFTVTGSANTLTTGAATALNVTSTTIGASGLNFRSVDSNGAGNGIVLNTTGSSGGLSVTGTGSTAGSGGTIQGATNRGVSAISTNSLSLKNMNFTNDGTANGADPTIATSACGDLLTGSNTACNAAIHMDGVSGATLDTLSVSGGNQIGINGVNVSALTLANSTIQNAGDQTREDGVRFRDLKGTSSITNSTLQGNEDDQLRIANGNGATGTLNISGSTFQNSTNPNGEYGFQLDTIGSGSMTTTIGTSTFNNLRGGGLVATAQNSSTLNVTASGGTWRGNFGAISNFDSAIQVVGADSANVKFNIHDITNPMLGYGLNVIHFQTNSPGTESLQGQVINNVIGDTSSSTSASTTGAGIGVNQQSRSNVGVRLSGNTIKGVATFGITVQMGNLTTAATSMDAIVQNNNIAVTTTATALQGIFFNSGTTSADPPSGRPEDAGTFCADVSGNVASSVNADGLRLRQRFGTTVQLPGYAGGAADTSAVNTYLGNRNASLGDTISSTTQSPGGFANANCDAPTLP